MGWDGQVCLMLTVVLWAAEKKTAVSFRAVCVVVSRSASYNTLVYAE